MQWQLKDSSTEAKYVTIFDLLIRALFYIKNFWLIHFF